MCEIIRFPLKAPTPIKTLEFYTWEGILGDQPPQRRKTALMMAYRGGVMPADTVAYLMDHWRLGSV